MAQQRDPELTDAALMATCNLWAYLTPERRRDMLVNRIAEYLFTALYADVPKGCYSDGQTEQLIEAAGELLQLVNREGVNEDVIEWAWQSKFWFHYLKPETIAQRIADLAETFTHKEGTETGPLFDFVRDLGANDGG